ncbi:hypothetical protein KC316_g15239, partial [Hortaea werneckii]
MTAFQNERPDADEQLSNTVCIASSSSSSSPAHQMDLYDQLCTSPKHFADCCVGISQPLLATLASRLPPSPALILSIGSGSGLLEAMLLKMHSGKPLDLFGVEVSSCVNKHLPPDRVVKVPSTSSLHPDAMLASSLMFVYPRMPALVSAYLDASTGGALEQIVWLGHRSDWPDFESVMRSRSSSVDIVEGSGLSTNPEPHKKKPSMPSLLNPNLSQTSTDPQRPSPHQQPRLSSEHIDLWEHAALLYHHFEWHSAIDTFQHLALTIPAEAKEARTLCLLNAAIIQARLGDYALAAQTLEAAARTDGSFILTPYLLGIMEWELGNLIKAEACLEILLLALRRHAGEGIVDFSRHGLDFRLQGEVVREELRRLRGVNPFSEEAAAAAAAQSQIVGFAGFSANCIFEAPVREGGRSKEEEEDLTVKRRREEEEHFIPVGGGKAAINRQPDSLVVESSSSPKPTTTKNPRETFQDLKAFLRGHKPMPTPNRPNTRTSAAPPDPLRPRPRPPQPAQPLPSPAATPEATYHSTWRRRPTTPYIPRDARGEHHSVGELAR